MKKDLQRIKKWLLPTCTVLLVGLSLSNYFSNNVLGTLEGVSDKISDSTKVISVLTKGVGFFYASKVGEVSGFVKVTIDELNKLSDYLTVINILLEIQELILKFASLTVVKLLPFLFLSGLYVKRFKKTALKLLIYSLLISPGLSIFMAVIHEVPQAINSVPLGEDLNAELKVIEQNFQQKKSKLKKHQQDVKNRQLLKAKAKGRDHISFIKRAEDAIVNAAENTVLKVEKEAEIVKEVLVLDTEKLVLFIVKLISMVIFIVVLLPLFYFYGITIIVREVSVLLHAIIHKE